MDRPTDGQTEGTQARAITNDLVVGSKIIKTNEQSLEIFDDGPMD